MEHLHQTVAADIVGVVLWHGPQDIIGDGPEEGQLVVQRGIEYDVGFLLIWKDPLFLSLAHAVPHGKRILRPGSAELPVAYQAAQQTRVRRTDAVVVIKIYAGQLADIDQAGQTSLKAFMKGGVERVNAFNDQRLIRRDACGNIAFLAFFCLKAEPGHLRFFAPQKLSEAFSEKINIQRAQRLEVRLSVRFKRQIIAVNVKIIQRDDHGPEPVHPQVNGEPVGKGCLAAGGWTGNEDGAGITVDDILRDLGQRFVMQGFVDADQLPDTALFDERVQLRHCRTAEHSAPVARLAVDGHVLGQAVISCRP